MPAKEVEEIESFVAHNYKVLVVDDNLINRKVALGFLKPYEFDVTEASSGFEAIELVRGARFDMVFMDHMMPEMDGIEAARVIREECGENGKAPVMIALTANAMEGMKDKFLQNGFQDFLSKPLEKKSLHECLQSWIPESHQKTYTVTNPGRMPGKKADSAAIQIRGINAEEAMSRQSGNIDDYVELLWLYCMDGRRKRGLLKELVKNEDFKAYGIEVHGLKGASANVGAMGIFALAQTHEEAADRGDGQFISSHFFELLFCYERQLQYIQDFLDKRREAAQDEAERHDGIDRETLIGEIRESLKKLENFRSKQCAQKIEELLKHQLDPDTETKLKEIQEQLRMYEDDTAERLLHQLLEQFDKEGLH